jgi:hypothetical protein
MRNDRIFLEESEKQLLEVFYDLINHNWNPILITGYQDHFINLFWKFHNKLEWKYGFKLATHYIDKECGEIKKRKEGGK